jgi:hypothetical protein
MPGVRQANGSSRWLQGDMKATVAFSFKGRGKEHLSQSRTQIDLGGVTSPHKAPQFLSLSLWPFSHSPLPASHPLCLELPQGLHQAPHDKWESQKRAAGDPSELCNLHKSRSSHGQVRNWDPWSWIQQNPGYRMVNNLQRQIDPSWKLKASLLIRLTYFTKNSVISYKKLFWSSLVDRIIIT